MKPNREQRKQQRQPVSRTPQGTSEAAAQHFQRRPLLLLLATVLVAGWIAFLSVMAFRH